MQSTSSTETEAASVINSETAADFKHFKTDAEAERWMDVHRVLYAEGLLAPEKQAAIEKIEGWEWNVSHIKPGFRALVIRAYHAGQSEQR